MIKAASDVILLAKTKLASSGLTDDDAKKLSITVLNDDESCFGEKRSKPRPALRIPYFYPDGSPITADLQGRGTPFYRLRYLTKIVLRDSKGTPKQLRYVQPPGSGTYAYFPQNIDWTDLVFDPSKPLIITEGELKAAKACKEGFPTIGLGGVFNFRSTTRGLTFLPELDAFNWEHRSVYICFDSDYKTNSQICAAITELSNQLIMRGAVPHVVSLPSIRDEGKTGLDDLLTVGGVDAFQEALHNSLAFDVARKLYQLNEKYIMVRYPSTVVERHTNNMCSAAVFRDVLHCNDFIIDARLNANGTKSHKRMPVGPAWVSWPLRAEANSLVYEPGKPKIIQVPGEDGVNYNLWRGWGTVPVKGDVGPFLDLFNHLTTGLEEDAKRWLLRWMAFPIQYPGAKLFTSVLFHGVKQGTGKSLLGLTLGKIYGKNFATIKEKDLTKNFNSWAKHKQFVLGDDITGSDKRQESGELRKMITQDTITIDEKYIPSYTLRDCINYYLTSNLPDALYMENYDRRSFVHEVTVDALPTEFYMEYDTWFNGRGPSYLHHYLLHEVDLDDFIATTAAPHTAAKHRMIIDAKSDLGTWVEGLLADPDAHLVEGSIPLEQDLFTSKDLLNLYDPKHTGRVTSNGLSRELKKAGLKQVWDGQLVKVNGKLDRYYALRNKERWETATPAEIREHLEEMEVKQRKSKLKTRKPAKF